MTGPKHRAAELGAAELLRQLGSVQAKLDIALTDLELARANLTAAAHALVTAGIDGALLRRCGCSDCERVYEVLREVGQIKEPWSE